MPFVVVYDASVLHPPTVRDLLIRIAQAGLVQARWTDEILDETFRSILRRRPDLAPDRLERTRSPMCEAVRDCMVVGYEPLVGAIELPDPWNVEAKSPDDFVLDQFHLDGAAVHGAVQRVADAWRNPPGSVDDVLDRLERTGLVEAAALLRR